MTHPLFRITDGQDALLKLHSQAVAQPKRKPPFVLPSAYEEACANFESGTHLAVCHHSIGCTECNWCGFFDASALQQRVDTAGDAQTGGFPASEQPDAVAEAPEQWHTEAPTVAGIYATRRVWHNDFDTDTFANRWYDGKAWHAFVPRTDPRECPMFATYGVRIEWLKLIEADAPQADTRPLLQWVKGCDVPEAERGGLWHLERYECDGIGMPASLSCQFIFNFRYLRAAPGVREGDSFDPALYREVK